jgi:hypothetical protein
MLVAEVAMPMLADFEYADRWGEFIIVAGFLFLTWAASVGLALVALSLAFSPHARRASRRCAIAGIIASVPITLFDAALFLNLVEPGGSTEHWPFAAVTLAPLIVAIAVFRIDQHLLRNNREAIDAD